MDLVEIKNYSETWDPVGRFDIKIYRPILAANEVLKFQKYDIFAYFSANLAPGSFFFQNLILVQNHPQNIKNVFFEHL